MTAKMTAAAEATLTISGRHPKEMVFPLDALLRKCS
jgi:hypothetical protein